MKVRDYNIIILTQKNPKQLYEDINRNCEGAKISNKAVTEGDKENYK